MKKFFLFSALALIASVSPAFAASTFTWSEGVFTLPAPVVWNLYVGWQSVSVSQEIGGDLFGAAGNELRITAPVQGDIAWVASSISVDAKVAGDVRIAAANVYVNQNVDGDLLIAGANVVIAPNVVVWWDLVVWGAKVDIKWVVRWNAKIRSSVLHMGSEINGDLLASYEEVTIVSGAKVLWSISYKAPAKNSMLEGISSGVVHYTFIESSKNGIKKDFKNGFEKGLMTLVTWYVLYKRFVMALFAAIMIFVWRKFFVWVSNVLRKKPWMSFLTWFLVYTCAPIVIFFIALTVIGLPIARILASLYVALLFVGGMASSAVLASWMIENFMGGLEKAQRWKIIVTVLVIAFLFAVISGVDIIAVFFAMGALISYKMSLMKKMMESIE